MVRNSWLVLFSLCFFEALCLGQSETALAPKAKGGTQNPAQKPPTEITAKKSASFDGKGQIAVFVGEVKVKDSQFDLSCEKLTAYMVNQSVDNSSEPKKGGLDRVIAEGNVVIVQEKPGENPGETRRYVAKAEKAEYNAESQDLKLSGWPQVQEGVNAHMATSSSTIMYLSRSGKLRTEGFSKTVLQEQAQDKK